MVIKFHGDEEERRMLSEAEISRIKPNETE